MIIKDNHLWNKLDSWVITPLTGEGLKKAKKVKCYNCKKVGHFVRDCWVLGGGCKGKGPKQKEKADSKGKGKEVAAKMEENDDDLDGVWMATVDDDIHGWIDKCGGDTGNEYEMWMEDEISVETDEWVEGVCQDNMMYSPDTTVSDMDDILTSFDVSLISSKTSSDSESGSMPDLISLSDSIETDEVETESGSVPDLETLSDSVRTDEVEVEVGDKSLEDILAIDDGEELMTYSLTAIMLADTGSTFKMELFDSGVTCHMSPYKHKFINFIPIQRKVLITADGSHFEAVGKGDM